MVRIIIPIAGKARFQNRTWPPEVVCGAEYTRLRLCYFCNQAVVGVLEANFAE